MSRSTSAGAPARADSAIRSADAVLALVASQVSHLSRELSLTSGAVLGTLDRTGPRRVTDLAAIARITQPSATALVTGLERAGLVRRQSDPGDKRVVLVAITQAGSDWVRELRRVHVDSFAQLIEQLPGDEAAALAAAVPAMQHLREIEDRQHALNVPVAEPLRSTKT